MEATGTASVAMAGRFLWAPENSRNVPVESR